MDTRIRTFTGKRVDPFNLHYSDIVIEDIAHSLANQCRFNGATKEFYSVAQHSVIISHRVPANYAKWGLLHDASEAYLCDIPRPIKYRPEFAFYREAENKAMDTIATVFGLCTVMPGVVKDYDDDMIAYERASFLSGYETVFLPQIVSLAPKDAERVFLQRYKDLYGCTK